MPTLPPMSEKLRSPAPLVGLFPALLALAITGASLDGPALWRDEAVTAGMARRPLDSFFPVLEHIDAVHGLYYLMMNGIVRLFGDGVTTLRAPSVLGAVLTAWATAELGRRLGGTRVGLFAGTLVAISPVLSRYAQEARQYTLTTGLAVLATLLLVRALHERPVLGNDPQTSGSRFERSSLRSGRPKRAGLFWYGVTLGLLGLLHLFTLLLVPAHLVTVLLRRDTHLLLRWAAATCAALAPCALLASIALTQSGQVGWIEPPDAGAVTDMLDNLAGTPGFFAFSVALILLGRNAEIWRTATPWMVLPPVFLLVVSIWNPFYVFRYVLFCLPAVALLVASGMDRLRWSAGPPVLLAAALLAVPAHQALRQPSDRPDDLRALAGIIETESRPGDAIVFHYTGYRRAMSAYPAVYRGLNDVFADRPGQGLDGTEVPSQEFDARLQGVQRIFYIDNTRRPSSGAFASPDLIKETTIRHNRGSWVRIGHWLFKGGSVHLYERRSPFT